MRKFYFLAAALCLYASTYAQTDSTKKERTADTIRVGSMIIIKRGSSHKNDNDGSAVEITHKRVNKPSNVRTNWGVFDIGFNNYRDNTMYSSAAAQQFAPGGNEDWFNLRNGKSVNINIWFFMQRLNAVKQVVNIVYGLGLELNNYRYQDNIRYTEKNTIVYMDPTIKYSKNKLAADYVTVPLMLNINFTPGKDNSKTFGISGGVSGGYRYSSRQKFISAETGKQKVHDDFNLRSYKLSYIAELQLGPIKVYGSMASKSMFKNGLDQTPYNVGLRFSNW